MSLKLDEAGRQVHLTRGLFCRVWEPHDIGDRIIASRQADRWTFELVTTLELASFHTEGEFRDELICGLFQSFVGTSKLPLTSLESPLPEFVLGEAAYGYRSARPEDLEVRTGASWLHCHAGAEAWIERIKVVEMALRTTPKDDMPELASAFGRWTDSLGWDARQSITLLLHVFNEATLTPYTDFVSKTLEFTGELERARRIGRSERIDFFTTLVRQIVRHLTAYDLTRFHHRGANYPDALVLDGCLKSILWTVRDSPNLFITEPSDAAADRQAKRRRRRALRLGLLVREFYEGLPVPDRPTSPGENTRILPQPHAIIPEEQIGQVAARTKRLFSNDPLGLYAEKLSPDLLQAMSDDLEEISELQELGMALFLERPLGAGKERGEPDQTPLFSYEAFSKKIAGSRLEQWARRVTREGWLEDQLARLDATPAVGIAASEYAMAHSTAIVSLADANHASEDFVFLRSTNPSLHRFLRLFDVRPALAVGRWTLPVFSRVLLIRSPEAPESGQVRLTLYDHACEPRMEMEIAEPGAGYETRGGVEYPRRGLNVTAVWSGSGNTRPNVLSSPISLPVLRHVPSTLEPWLS